MRVLNSLQFNRTTRARFVGSVSQKLKSAGSHVGFAALILMFVLVGAVSAQHRISLSGDTQAKISYCKDCHGVSAQGFNGYYPIPRLAGQQSIYLENQLRAFIEHRRTNNIMFNVSHSLSPAMVNALAAHFASLNPPPIGGAPRQLVATGRKIFEDGMPEVNIAACAACHGPEATGSGQIPRLAGQLYPYMIKTLGSWDKERGRNPTVPDAAAIMSPVAHSLNKSQIEAVAAFVSTLRPPRGTPNAVQ